MPPRIAIGTVPADADTEQERELDVAHPHPARIGKRDEEEEERGAEPGDEPLTTLGCHASWSASTTTVAGSTTLFGTIRCSMSVAEIVTSAAQKIAAGERLEAGPPKTTKQAAASSAVASSTAGYRQPIECAARAAAAAEEEVRDDRDVVAGPDLARRSAGRPSAGSTTDRPSGQPRGDDVQEAADGKRGREDERRRRRRSRSCIDRQRSPTLESRRPGGYGDAGGAQSLTTGCEPQDRGRSTRPGTSPSSAPSGSDRLGHPPRPAAA